MHKLLRISAIELWISNLGRSEITKRRRGTGSGFCSLSSSLVMSIINAETLRAAMFARATPRVLDAGGISILGANM